MIMTTNSIVPHADTFIRSMSTMPMAATPSMHDKQSSNKETKFLTIDLGKKAEISCLVKLLPEVLILKPAGRFMAGQPIVVVAGNVGTGAAPTMTPVPAGRAGKA